jgi:hypothetical protein
MKEVWSQGCNSSNRNKERISKNCNTVRAVAIQVMKDRGGGGMTVLRGEDEGGTKTLLEEAKIAETLRNFAIKHYGQDNKMVFGGGDIYQQLTENPMTNPIYEELLTGTFEYRADLTVEQKLFV